METQRNGRSPETAFIIQDSSGEMTASIGEFVENMFGGEDGSYFIHSETTLENRGKDKRYKVLYVEEPSKEKIHMLNNYFQFLQPLLFRYLLSQGFLSAV